jgi:hypothetical protein
MLHLSHSLTNRFFSFLLLNQRQHPLMILPHFNLIFVFYRFWIRRNNSLWNRCQLIRGFSLDWTSLYRTFFLRAVRSSNLNIVVAILLINVLDLWLNFSISWRGNSCSLSIIIWAWQGFSCLLFVIFFELFDLDHRILSPLDVKLLSVIIFTHIVFFVIFTVLQLMVWIFDISFAYPEWLNLIV